MARTLLLALLTLLAVATAILWADSSLDARMPPYWSHTWTDVGIRVYRGYFYYQVAHCPICGRGLPSFDDTIVGCRCTPGNGLLYDSAVVHILGFDRMRRIVTSAPNFSGTVFYFPLWLLSLLLASYPAFAVALIPVRRVRRRRQGRCARCAYDLTGNVSGVCPECGVATSGHAQSAVPPLARLAACLEPRTLRILLTVAGVACVFLIWRALIGVDSPLPAYLGMYVLAIGAPVALIWAMRRPPRE